MAYALILKDSGEGCDYTLGCGWRPEVFNHEPTALDIGEVIERVGVENLESITVVKIEKIIGRAELGDYKLAEDDDEEDDEDEETAARRAQYEALRREFE